MRRRSVIWLFVISGLLHAYVGLRLLPDLPGGTAASTALLIWLIAGSLLTPLALINSHTASRASTRVAVWLGYVTMGALSSLWVLTLLRDLLWLALNASLWLGAPLSGLAADYAPVSACAVLGISALITALGFVNARRSPATREVDVPIAGLHSGLHGFRIAQLSDIHIGATIRAGWIAALVDKVNALEADAVVITGDMVDGHPDELAPHAEPLAGLRARHGVFGVTGNHEYYSGTHLWLPVFERLGITMLLNAHRVLDHGGAPLLMGGITDYTAHKFDPAHASDPVKALHGAPDGVFRLLLAHQPRSAAAAEQAGFHLQLSGHTHGGQFLPWPLFVRLQQPFVAGLDRLGKLLVYTSRGTGYWGPPLRFGAPSEITLLRLIAV